jgi:hypothetical protein
MRGTKAKRLRRQSELLLIEWLQTMVPEGEDATKITLKNLQDFLPEQTHIYANYKQVKNNPDITLEDIMT